MTRIIAWLNNPIFLAFLLAVGLTVDLVLIGRYYCLNASEWASWVQAIGSIAAILGSVWVAVHSTNSSNKAREEDEREASVSHVIFTRALFRQAANSASLIKACAENADLQKMKQEAAQLLDIANTLKPLISQSRDWELTGLLVSAYESMTICHSQAKTCEMKATEIAFAEFAAGSTLRELDKLRALLHPLAKRLKVPAEPAGPAADFDILPPESPVEN